jgi:phage terminase Nu1 subunit (DNA packaging protein)
MTLPKLTAARKATKAQLAEFFDVSIPTIDAWIRKGMPVVERGSKTTPWVFDLLAVTLWKFAPDAAGEDAPVDPERLPPGERKAWYDSEMRRREMQKDDRELIPAAEVGQVVATAFAAVAQSIRSLPDNLERRLSLAPEVVDEIGRAMDEHLDDLAARLQILGPVDEVASAR